MKFKPYMLVVVLVVLFFLFSFKKSGYDIPTMVGSTPGATLMTSSPDDGSYMADAQSYMGADFTMATTAPAQSSSSQSFMCTSM